MYTSNNEHKVMNMVFQTVDELVNFLDSKAQFAPYRNMEAIYDDVIYDGIPLELLASAGVTGINLAALIDEEDDYDVRITFKKLYQFSTGLVLRGRHLQDDGLVTIVGNGG
jgi:hypothetical protein